jgi:hypothetical protein
MNLEMLGQNTSQAEVTHISCSWNMDSGKQ